jgi:hypothetical protein
VFNSGFAEGSNSSVLTFGTRTMRDVDELYSPTSIGSRNFEDSDDEDEETFLDADEDHSVEFSDSDPGQSMHVATASASALSTVLTEDSDEAVFAETDGEQRNVRQKMSHPSSPRTADKVVIKDEHEAVNMSQRFMTRVIVRDASLATYRSVLYYVKILDAIAFALIGDSIS